MTIETDNYVVRRPGGSGLRKKFTSDQINAAVFRNNGNKKAAAKELGVCVDTIYRYENIDRHHRGYQSFTRYRARDPFWTTIRDRTCAANGRAKKEEKRILNEQGREANLGRIKSKELLAKAKATTHCYYSGKRLDYDNDDWQIDHLVPLARGGLNHIDNIVICLAAYNTAKSDLTYEELLYVCRTILAEDERRKKKTDPWKVYERKGRLAA